MMNKIQIVPTLSVKNANAAIEYYKKAFDAQELMRNTSPGGDVVAELSIGDARFVVADEAPEHENFSPETLGGTPVRIGLQVENPDDVYEQAVSAGAKEIYPVADQDYGYRLGHLVDPFGHHWEIFTPLHKKFTGTSK
ncbi:MAG: VOC family protein [Ginsengibacter sp.]